MWLAESKLKYALLGRALRLSALDDQRERKKPRVSVGLLDQLGLGALAGFAVGLAVAGNPDDRRTPQQLARDTLAECLRLVEASRVSAALPAASPAPSLAATLSRPMDVIQGATAPTEEPRPRRRRRTRVEMEADAVAAAAAPAPVPEEAPRPRRGGRRPRQETAPVEAIVAADAGMAPPPEAPAPPARRGRRPQPVAEAPVEPPQEEPTPRRRRQPAEPGGNGAVAAAAPPPEAPPPAVAEAPARPADSRINLNTATRGELLRLPRIGAQAADRIIEFREQQGRISGVRQLRNADALSAAQWRQIRDLVRF
jgi:hypothetical protein